MGYRTEYFCDKCKNGFKQSKLLYLSLGNNGWRGRAGKHLCSDCVKALERFLENQ